MRTQQHAEKQQQFINTFKTYLSLIRCQVLRKGGSNVLKKALLNKVLDNTENKHTQCTSK